MRKICVVFLLFFMILFAIFSGAHAENNGVSSIRDLVLSEAKHFSFRNGVSWGMTPQQVAAVENVSMDYRTSSEWSVMVSSSPVTVSRFSADLVYMFYQDALRMITYEFQTDCSTLNYQYLTGALCSVYGESREASPDVIKGYMDCIYQNYYQKELIQYPLEWSYEDGTSIYLYYFTGQTYAILYVCPSASGSSGIYDINGL